MHGETCSSFRSQIAIEVICEQGEPVRDYRTMVTNAGAGCGAAPVLAASGPRIAVSEKPNLLKRIKLIWVVQSCLQKYSASHLTQITSRTPAVPLLTRGVSRSSRTRGRDAVDAAALLKTSA